MLFEVLTERDGRQVHTLLMKEKLLRSEAFWQNEDHLYNDLCPAVLTHSSNTQQGLERASCSQSVKHTPWRDKLLFGSLWLHNERNTERGAQGTKGAIQRGRHKAGSHWLIVDVICTIGNNGNMNLRSVHF